MGRLLGGAPLTLTALVLATACGGGGESLGPPEETPILGRESTGAYACRVTTPLENYAPRNWTYGGHALVAQGAQALLARIEAANDDWSMPSPYQFLVSTLSSAGEAGQSHVIDVQAPERLSAPSLAAMGERVALTWSDDRSIELVLLSPDGTPDGAPVKIVAETLNPGSRLQTASTGDLLAVTYLTEAHETKIVIVDATGTRVGAPVRLGSDYGVGEPALTARDDGFAVLWTARDAADASDDAPSRLYFASVDRTGSVGTPVEVARDAASVRWSFGTSKVSLASVRDGYVAAWTHMDYGHEDGGGSGVMRVARLAADGTMRGQSVLLSAPELDVELIEPNVAPFGDAVALSWARGSIIYVCAGCVPDHAIHTVLIDPDTLTPLSDVAAIEPEEGGLLARDMAVVGTDIVTVFEITFHTSSYAGFAALSCAAK